MRDRWRLVTVQNGKRHVSSVVLDKHEAADMLGAELIMHRGPAGTSSRTTGVPASSPPEPPIGGWCARSGRNASTPSTTLSPETARSSQEAPDRRGLLTSAAREGHDRTRDRTIGQSVTEDVAGASVIRAFAVLLPPAPTKPLIGCRPHPAALGEPTAGRQRRRVPSHPHGRRPGGRGRGATPKSNYGSEAKKGLGACQSQPEAAIAKCAHCEDSRSLRYDHQQQAWVCFQGCGNSQPQKPKRPATKKLQWKRSPLFEPVVSVDGVRRKLHHSELREAYRIWAAHKDIREGRFRG